MVLGTLLLATISAQYTSLYYSDWWRVQPLVRTITQVIVIALELSWTGSVSKALTSKAFGGESTKMQLTAVSSHTGRMPFLAAGAMAALECSRFNEFGYWRGVKATVATTLAPQAPVSEAPVQLPGEKRVETIG